MNLKHYSYIIIILFISINVKSNEINYDVSEEYSKIFRSNILSNDDIKKYQNIFLYQKKCEWKKANKHILTLKNDILMGHVLAQKYLHPDCYRSKFIELSSWLKMYNDHPQAKRIYRLAIRRMPEGYKRPSQPISAIGIDNNNEKKKKQSTKYESKFKLNKSQRNEKYKLLINIKSRVNKGWPTGALKLLNQKYVKNI